MQAHAVYQFRLHCQLITRDSTCPVEYHKTTSIWMAAGNPREVTTFVPLIYSKTRGSWTELLWPPCPLPTKSIMLMWIVYSVPSSLYDKFYWSWLYMWSEGPDSFRDAPTGHGGLKKAMELRAGSRSFANLVGDFKRTSKISFKSWTWATLTKRNSPTYRVTCGYPGQRLASEGGQSGGHLVWASAVG
jgi:hypothetical protein